MTRFDPDDTRPTRPAIEDYTREIETATLDAQMDELRAFGQRLADDAETVALEREPHIGGAVMTNHDREVSEWLRGVVGLPRAERVPKFDVGDRILFVSADGAHMVQAEVETVLVKDGDVAYVVNTGEGQEAFSEDRLIRRKAVVFIGATQEDE